MNNLFRENLQGFLKSNKLTKSEFAQSLNSANSRISSYLSGQSEPTLSFLLNFKENYKINLDDFLTKKLFFEEKNQDFQLFSRFSNNFILYFFDSSNYIGRTYRSNQNILKYGILSLIPKKDRLYAICYFTKDLEEAENIKSLLDENMSNREQVFNENCQIVYNGEVTFSFSQIFIFLKSYSDQSLIVLNNPPSNKDYIGGLGTVNSVSRGREHMPCVQFILLCNKVLPFPQGEIYNMLSLEKPSITLHGESEKLIELFNNLYLNEKNLLDDYQKRRIITDFLEKTIEENLEANLFRFAKVSAREDDFFYKILKGEI